MDSQSESEQSNPSSQSVFSERSGIQDLLIKPEGADSASAVAAPDKASETSSPEKNPEAPQSHPNKRSDKPHKSKRQIERVKRRQKNYLHERRAQKRRQVFFSRIRLLFKLCFACLFAILLWEIVQNPIWLYQKPLFALHDNALIQRQQIEPMLQKLVGKPIYQINPSALAQKIKKRFDIVDQVIIRRQVFPNRLEIMLAEKRPWAEVYTVDPIPSTKNQPEKNETTQKSPEIYDKAKDVPRPYALLVPYGVVSLTPYAYRPEIYSKPALEKIILPPHTVMTQQYLHDLQEISWQAHLFRGLHLQYVDARNPQRIVLHFQEIPVILGTLNRTASERLSHLFPLIPKIFELHDAIESVDLRWEEQVTFHKKPNAKIVLAQDEETAH